jgi:regulator of PEP synthase PpsR (kinase-PPPase family)
MFVIVGGFHLISDSTGETLITVARAVVAQYTHVTPVEHVYPLVRSNGSAWLRGGSLPYTKKDPTKIVSRII